jgi:hypothetical protein
MFSLLFIVALILLQFFLLCLYKVFGSFIIEEKFNFVKNSQEAVQAENNRSSGGRVCHRQNFQGDWHQQSKTTGGTTRGNEGLGGARIGTLWVAFICPPYFPICPKNVLLPHVCDVFFSIFFHISWLHMTAKNMDSNIKKNPSKRAG